LVELGGGVKMRPVNRDASRHCHHFRHIDRLDCDGRFPLTLALSLKGEGSSWRFCPDSARSSTLGPVEVSNAPGEQAVNNF